jgi:3-hydroxy-9,10-secoandrosta-1,3,5(10)-triene-9,17-dione monooxygenase
MSAVPKGKQEPAVTEAVVMQRLEALVPKLRERAAETEKLRKVPQATFDDVKATGYLSGFRTRHFGGPGLGLSALANGARIMAHGCGSSAWVMLFLAQHTWMFAKANLKLQEELLGGEFPAMQAGALGKVGVAKRVPGGYRVTARTDWNTGVMNSTWVNCKAIIQSDNPNEDKRVMMCVFPIGDVVIEDIWHTAGARGTGSNILVANDVFVPEYRVQPSEEFLGAKAPSIHDNEPWASYPFVPVATMTLAAVALGMAEGAYEEFKNMMVSRTLAFSGGAKQVEQPTSQMRLGEALGQLRIAQTIFHTTLKKIIDTCEPRGTLSTEDRVGIRLAGAQVVHACRDLLNDTIMPNAGGGSYYLGAVLQRMQRDIEMLKGHALFDWDRVALMAGKEALGIAPAPTDLL